MSDNAIPWYKSSIIVGLVVSIISKALLVTGLGADLAPSAQIELTNLIITFIGLAGDAWAFRGRLRQQASPDIALTKAGADKKNALEIGGILSDIVEDVVISPEPFRPTTIPDILLGQAEAALREQMK